MDDGSPDGCPKICEDWVKRDKRIKVIHKANEGLGYARKYGNWKTLLGSIYAFLIAMITLQLIR